MKDFKDLTPSEAFRFAVDLQNDVDAYCRKPGNICGGALHVVLDDGNYETHHVEFCREYAVEIGDADAIALADKLLSLPDADRVYFLGLFDDDDEVSDD